MTSYAVTRQPRHAGSFWLAIVAGTAVAMLGAALWGTVGYLLRGQLSLIAVLIGLAVGLVMARLRPGDRLVAVPSAILSLLGCALGSLVAEILIALADGIPASLLLARPGQIAHAYPATVGWPGLVFWIIAAIVGLAVPAGPGLPRLRRRPATQTGSSATRR